MFRNFNDCVPLIFLDVDGVLNSEKWYKKRGHNFDMETSYPIREFDPESVDYLNKIIYETGAKIVFSSSWRIGRTIAELQYLLDSVGCIGEVIGRTGSIRSQTRGHEIHDWLVTFLNSFSQTPSKFIIIDDDSDMLGYQMPFFIKTTFKTGLTLDNAEKAIKILNGINI